MVLLMQRWKGKVAIVTGANGGIGAAIIQQLIKQDLKVVGLDCNSDAIEELAENLPGVFYALKTDIRKEEEVLEAFNWVTENVGPVHILVNCAGVILQTSLIEGDTGKWKRTFDTNVLGLCVTTREAVKIMKRNKIDGHIVHINSLAGHVVHNIADINVYPATKHAVTALTESLRLEFSRLGLKIKITSVSPGAVDTQIFQNNGFVMPSQVNEWPKVKPEDVADCVLFALSSPPHVQIHELTIKAVGEVL